jgi:hypothetical protein
LKSECSSPGGLSKHENQAFEGLVFFFERAAFDTDDLLALFDNKFVRFGSVMVMGILSSVSICGSTREERAILILCELDFQLVEVVRD